MSDDRHDTTRDTLRDTLRDEATIAELRARMAERTAGHEYEPTAAVRRPDGLDRRRRIPAGIGIAAASLVVAGTAVGIGLVRHQPTTPSARNPIAVTSTSLTPAAHTAVVPTTMPPPTKPIIGSAPATSACAGAVAAGALPSWARSGFNAGAIDQRHVTGARGAIVGVLFTNPLRVHQAAGQQNKVLWVARNPNTTGALSIHARLEGSDIATDRSVAGGPGPSTLDLPEAGCWLLTLHWAGRTDSVAMPVSA